MSVGLLKKICFLYIILIPCLSLFSGCGPGKPAGGQSPPGTTQTQEEASSSSAASQSSPTENHGSARRPAVVLIPEAPSTSVIGNESITIDTTNVSEGYFVVTYLGDNAKVKFQVTGPNEVKYTYNITNSSCVIPLAAGDGTYQIGLYENISGSQYSTAYTGNFSAVLTNDFGPFLYPNLYVNFTKDTKAVALAEELCATLGTDLDVVTQVYHYVVDNISYDYDEAETVAYNYLPDVDEVLETKKGICFDYASLMAAMLRSQSIPTRLEIGYAGEDYHAWISTYIEGKGWVDGIIQFDGRVWTLMDPTYISSSNNSKNAQRFVTNKSNYNTVYIY